MPPRSPQVKDVATGQVISTTNPDLELVEAVVVGNAHFVREDPKDPESPILRYGHGQRLHVTRRTLRECVGVLRATNNADQPPPALDLRDIAGIGRKSLQRLLADGVTTVEAFVAAQPDALAASLGCSVKVAVQMQTEARNLLEQEENKAMGFGTATNNADARRDEALPPPPPGVRRKSISAAASGGKHFSPAGPGPRPEPDASEAPEPQA